MASSKVVSRLSSRLRPLSLKLNHSPPSPPAPLQSSVSPSSRRFSRAFSRLPLELSGGVESLMPLHSAIASARLQSSLAMESQSWGLVPQGISMPL
ncbi:protein NUCLEAR FUSION DEFECTIVE 6, mitochondrial-like [Rhodamnia argentea]|uniref:Protein NUCLEAR FUSION DEFECTIVE 6, mitochondrial-like n=1 Tax=Rhodamnia argentea TaxID=178133 RepID=A0A8B8Q3T0_9MYRT|nr:protein NUCLEAR FUSION DEFECTIVE 6, mitochondrial-like [Rhodamnia argentea]